MTFQVGQKVLWRSYAEQYGEEPLPAEIVEVTRTGIRSRELKGNSTRNFIHYTTGRYECGAYWLEPGLTTPVEEPVKPLRDRILSKLLDHLEREVERHTGGYWQSKTEDQAIDLVLREMVECYTRAQAEWYRERDD